MFLDLGKSCSYGEVGDENDRQRQTSCYFHYHPSSTAEWRRICVEPTNIDRIRHLPHVTYVLIAQNGDSTPLYVSLWCLM